MSTRQLGIIFICTLIPWTVGAAFAALLPVYVTQLGADSVTAGNYVAVTFLALSIGTVAGGWLFDQLPRRKPLLLIAGLVSAAATGLMSRTTDIGLLMALTSTAYLAGGIVLAITNALVGLLAEPSQRGKTFGIIGISLGLGNFIGGVASGPIVDHWGFPVLFIVLAGCWLLPLVATRFLEEAGGHGEPSAPKAALSALGMPFYLLLIANTLAWLSIFIADLGRPLQMNAFSFGATAISDTTAIAGAVSIPLPFLLGWLADRFDHRRLIALCFLAGVLSLVLLAFSTALWHFWISTIFGTLVSASSIVGSALVTDLVAPEALGQALSRYGATGWIAGVIGSALTGYAIQSLGMEQTFILGALLPLLGTLIVSRIHLARRVAVTESFPSA
ncbi:MAG TPA: MFS transporter [Phototrophicaceae bacterium]|nr:MFS transporter [Phototrophicaceae bacterium]